MAFLSFIFAALLVLAGAVATSLWDAQVSVQASSQEVAGASMRVMAGVVRAFIAAHPEKDGEVSGEELAPFTPTWFKAESGVRTIVKAGRGYIFIVPKDGNRPSTETVIAGSEMPATLGISRAGKLISPVAGAVSLDIPSTIPDGSLVYGI